MTEDKLILWGWFLWGCDRRRYPVSWREFDKAVRWQGPAQWLITGDIPIQPSQPPEDFLEDRPHPLEDVPHGAKGL